MWLQRLIETFYLLAEKLASGNSDLDRPTTVWDLEIFPKAFLDLEIHVYEVYVHEVYAYEVHAREIHAHDV